MRLLRSVSGSNLQVLWQNVSSEFISGSTDSINLSYFLAGVASHTAQSGDAAVWLYSLSSWSFQYF